MNSAHSYTEGMDVPTENILFNDRVRKKNKSFWDIFTFSYYYENEKISLKEKAYTFLYNMQRTGMTTKGEMDWSLRMSQIDYGGWKKLEEQFNEDYKDFLNKS